MDVFLIKLAVVAVVAETEMQVLVISQEFLQQAMKALPEVAMRLLYNLNGVLCEKLQKTTKDWVGAMECPAVERARPVEGLWGRDARA